MDARPACVTLQTPMWRPRRFALTSAGLAMIGLGFLGALLPGLPTTPFLLLAAWCFARSDRKLGRRMLALPVFRPYRRFLDGSKPIPPRVRWITIGFVWVFAGTSAWLFRERPWLAALLLVAAFAGSVVILRIRRSVRDELEPGG